MTKVAVGGMVAVPVGRESWWGRRGRGGHDGRAGQHDEGQGDREHGKLRWCSHLHGVYRVTGHQWEALCQTQDQSSSRKAKVHTLPECTMIAEPGAP